VVTANVRIGSIAELGRSTAVAMPVAKDDQGLLVPQGLPAEVLGLSVPTELDGGWAAEQGFDGEAGQSLVLRNVGRPSLVLLGVGDAVTADAEVWRRAGAAAVRASGKAEAVAVLLPLPSTIATADAASAVVEGALLAAYRAGGSKTAAAPVLPAEVVLVPVALEGLRDEDRAQVAAGARRGEVLADAVCWARDMINRPAAQLTPRRFAHEALRLLENDPGVTVEIWRDAELEAERCGGLLGVARGSLEPPRLVRASYDPDPGGDLPHVVLVGKGITFDSGGLNIKSFEGMATMKTDMTGAAIVLGALSAASRLAARCRVTAIAPLTENLPGHRAMKPGDVLTARNGKTIEVLNTDAEGRLVLADGLSLAAELEPDAIVDVATLTGAVRVALGSDVAAVMGSDEGLVRTLCELGEREGEPLWELPLVDRYESHLESEIADMKNIGKPGNAGTIVAGLFLRRFTDGRPWAHLDVAGTGRSEADDGYVAKGATAFSLRTLAAYVLSR
jgi:leucyl aminopeptidase